MLFYEYNDGQNKDIMSALMKLPGARVNSKSYKCEITSALHISQERNCWSL